MSLCPDRLTPKIGQPAAGSKELPSHLRSKRSMRRSKPVDPKGDRRGTGKGLLIVDDLVDTGKTGRVNAEDSASTMHLLPGPDGRLAATLALTPANNVAGIKGSARSIDRKTQDKQDHENNKECVEQCSRNVSRYARSVSNAR